MKYFRLGKRFRSQNCIFCHAPPKYHLLKTFGVTLKNYASQMAQGNIKNPFKTVSTFNQCSLRKACVKFFAARVSKISLSSVSNGIMRRVEWWCVASVRGLLLTMFCLTCIQASSHFQVMAQLPVVFCFVASTGMMQKVCQHFDSCHGQCNRNAKALLRFVNVMYLFATRFSVCAFSRCQHN